MPYEYTDSASYSTLPHLSEMTGVALDILDNDTDGFFLMIEGGRIDHAGHDNLIRDNISETIEFAAAVQEAINWAAGRTDTLIIVTADHETGDLEVLQNAGEGVWPEDTAEPKDVDWGSTGHTGVNVPVYAWGVNAHTVGGIMDNTDMFELATTPEPATLVLMLSSLLIVCSRRRK
jgi:alkaline phosphatase